MANFRLRKRRTRQHVIADLSVHHIERFILEEGHTAQRLGSDYGYDLVMWTFDEEGFAEPGSVYFQLKASEILTEAETGYVFDLDIRDYNLWNHEKLPVILVLYNASRKQAFWLLVQQFFQADSTRSPKRGAKQVRVIVPKSQVVSRKAIRVIRALKRATLVQDGVTGPWNERK